MSRPFSPIGSDPAKESQLKPGMRRRFLVDLTLSPRTRRPSRTDVNRTFRIALRGIERASALALAKAGALHIVSWLDLCARLGSCHLREVTTLRCSGSRYPPGEAGLADLATRGSSELCLLMARKRPSRKRDLPV